MKDLYEAVLARDRRFDGKFVVAVKTTGVYCRPICPARPKPENVEFFPDAIAAEQAGYRPCLRCRPECAPHSPAWFGKSAVVALARLGGKSVVEPTKMNSPPGWASAADICDGFLHKRSAKHRNKFPIAPGLILPAS